MSVETIHGIRYFTCDDCAEVEEFDHHEPFKDCWEQLASQNWWCRQDSSGEWEHFCSVVCRPQTSLNSEPQGEPPDFLKNMRREK